VRESPQKSKKATNAKETKQKGSARTTSSSTRNAVESRKSKDAVLPNVSSSADQTAAGLLLCRNVKHVNSYHWSLYKHFKRVFYIGRIYQHINQFSVDH